MTERDLTRSLIYLNLYDMDGLIDIARTGITPATITPIKQDLLQRLANAIVGPIAPSDFDDDNPFDEPEPSNLFEGRVALAVYPLQPLTSEPVAQPKTIAARRAVQ